MKDFNGVKIALIKGNELLVIQRDDKPGFRYAGLWDFAGGGREDDESPIECATREIREELGITLKPASILWQKTYPAIHDASQTAYFMVAAIDNGDLASIVFGDEGQGWKLMSIKDFLSDPTVVEPLKGRLSDYLASSTSDRT